MKFIFAVLALAAAASAVNVGWGWNGGLGQVVLAGGGLNLGLGRWNAGLGAWNGGLGGWNAGLGGAPWNGWNAGWSWPNAPRDNLDVAVAKAAHISEHNRQTGNALVANAAANARNLLWAGNALGLGWSG